MISQSAEAPEATVRKDAHSQARIRGARADARKHQTRVNLAVFLSDLVLFNAAFALGYVIRYQLEWFRDIAFSASFADYGPIQILFNLSLLAFFWLDGVYAARRFSSWFDQIWTIIGSTIKAVFVVWVAIFIYGPAVYSRLMIAEAGIVLIVLMGITRAIRNWYDARLRANGVGVVNIMIVGAGELGRAVVRTLFARPELGYRCVGFVDDDPHRGRTDIGRFPALGDLAALPDLIARHEVGEVVITLPWSAQPKILGIVDQCQQLGVKARVVPSLLQLNLSKVNVDDFGGIPMLSRSERDIGAFNRLVKRGVDIVLGSVFLLISTPVVGIAALAVKLESPGPAIYSQLRSGQNGRPFKVFKLRSMHKDAEKERDQLLDLNEMDGPMFKIKADPRLTLVGRVLRKLSIDELPQFWNVLKGDMSIVGPRPALLSEIAEYDDWHSERLRVKPGITGLWQISGRSELSFDEMVLLDVYYIENWSPSLDFKIMLRTLPYVLSGRGAY